jgi:phosphatidylethanolamine/phosphatidyl-N-methylethanolamine N-methyltransferase
MTAVTGDLSRDDVRKAYGRWAHVYDALCGPVFRSAHRAAARAANAAGRDILEVGVGTGLLLPLYAPSSRVTGIDLSDDMLERARQRLRALGLPNVRALERCDIHLLEHPDESYDAVVFPFVLTLVEQPETALDNALRMLRPGGEIIVASHLRSASPLLARVEAALARCIAPLGLRPDFPLSRIAEWAGMRHATILSAEPIGLTGVYTLVRIRKSRADHSAAG